MSRSWKYLFAFAALSGQAALAQTAATDPAGSSQTAAAGQTSGTGQSSGAQQSTATSGTSAEDRAIAEKMFGTGRVTPDRSRSRCFKAARPGEIIVCGPDEQRDRVQSTAQLDPNSSDLRTPDVAGAGIFKGKATKSRMCLLGGCPPEAAYMIDLSSIPQAPAGSDADKIAKGELRAP